MGDMNELLIGMLSPHWKLKNDLALRFHTSLSVPLFFKSAFTLVKIA